MLVVLFLLLAATSLAGPLPARFLGCTGEKSPAAALLSELVLTLFRTAAAGFPFCLDTPPPRSSDVLIAALEAAVPHQD